MTKKEEQIVKDAHKYFAIFADAESENRVKMLADLKFVRLGDQWPESVKRDRERPGAERPMLTTNRIFQFRNQVINEIRQNKPSIKYRQADGEANEKAAHMRGDLVRSIQNKSHADIAYDTAVEWQVDAGLGYFRILTDYCDDEAVDEQDVVIKAVPDMFKVYYDNLSVEPDGSDAKRAFIAEEWSKDEFESEYPDVEVTGWDAKGTGDNWVFEDTIRIVEYFVIESKPRTRVKLQDGSTAWKDKIPEVYQHLITGERKSESRKCMWYKIAGNELLESTELPCSYIPIIPVYGVSIHLEGKRHVHGLTRFAKDPATLYNFFQSANAETLALAPRSPYIAAEGQLDGYEQEWSNADRVNISVLTYNPVSNLGQTLPAPRREPPVSSNPGFDTAMNRAIDDMKACMGIFDASLGNRESEQSGKAILSQQRQASIGNFHFSDNFSRSLKHAGRIINEMLSIYDTQQVMQVIGEDNSQKTIVIDPNAPEAYQELQDKDGKTIEVYNLSKGKYSCVVDTGPSYATKRQESAESMMQMAQADEQLMAVAGDIVYQNLDWPQAEEIAKRKKLMLPPPILQQIEKDEGDGAAPLDPAIEQQMTQMSQMVEHLSQELQTAQAGDKWKEEELEIKRFAEQTKRLEVEHKIALESTGLFHEIATSQMQQTLSEPNDGELEDKDEEPSETAPQPTVSGDMQ
ncbi:MAG: portal protein [Candidatus Paceibacterota bacterium]